MTERPKAGTTMSRDDMRALNAKMAASIDETAAQPFEDGSYVRRVMEVRGRKSGATIRVPIAVFQREGQRYVISPLRDRPWAENLRAAGACVLTAGGEHEHYRSAEVEPGPEAAAAAHGYVTAMSRYPYTAFAMRQFPFAPEATDEEVMSVIGTIAVFRLTHVEA